MTLPGQMELATVIDHSKKDCYWCCNTGIVQPEQGVTFGGYPCDECDRHKMNQQTNLEPAGVRLAKMLSQYDDQPSSQLWADIQRLAREILNASR